RCPYIRGSSFLLALGCLHKAKSEELDLFGDEGPMKYQSILALVTCLCVLPVAGAGRAGAEELDPKVKQAVDKGLEWLARNQNRDGHWEAAGGQYAPAMTGVAGMAMLAEGSTTREGKYANNIRKARDWFMSRSQPNGLLCNPGGMEAGR